MGRIITWCRHCLHVISFKHDSGDGDDKNGYGECGACAKGKGSWRKGGLLDKFRKDKKTEREEGNSAR